MIKRILKTITILTLLLPLCGVVLAGVDKTAGVGVNSTVQEPIVYGPVLDDFNDGGRLNNWGYDTGSYASAGATCVDSRDSISPKEGLFCLKLVYNVSTSGTYSGYWSKLGGKDLSGYTSISFWVKGTAGKELFKVELKNNSADTVRNHAAVYVTDYLDGGVTTSWTEVTIPFHNFVNLDGWNNMKELVVTFENSQSVTNGSPTQGTIYIDRISFSTTTVNEVRVDYYGDKIGTCALGGNIGDMPSINFTHSFSTSEYVSSPGGLGSTYNVGGADTWGGQFIIFGGGNDGWTEITHNFSAYNYVSICVKAKSATENPKELKIEIWDGSDRGFYARLVNIATTWQRFVIPLSYLVDAGLDKTTIKKMTLVYERSRIDAAGGRRQGVVYIDNIRVDVDNQ